MYAGDELFVVLNASSVPIYVIIQRKEKQWTADAEGKGLSVNVSPQGMHRQAT
jgi:hypothetical protein